MTVFVARHANVTTGGICYGQSDVPTDLDDDAACEVVASQVASLTKPIAHVWSSPWLRTRGPAARIAAGLGVPLTVDRRLSELAFGAWEGRPYAELENDPAFQVWMARWQSAAPPGGEHLDDLLARVRQWRDEVVARGQVALAITHAGVIRALRAGGRRARYASVVTEPVEHLKVEVVR